MSEINEKDRLIFGTGAVMNQTGEEWMINVPNGRYDVKIALKLIECPETLQKYPTPEDKAKMVFNLNNDLMQPEPLSTTDQIILDKPFLLVNEKEIRLR